MHKVLLSVIALLTSSTLLAATPAGAKQHAAPGGKPLSGEISITSKSPAAVDAFRKGRDYAENIRIVEATEQLKKTVELDPSFALAHAYLGSLTPGAEGLREIERGASLAKGLPEAERMLIDTMLADARGEEEKVRELWNKLAAIVPNDWRVQMGVGDQLSGQRKWDKAIASLKKATELNPKAGSAFNTMGYDYLNMGKNDQAIEAFRKYAALKPDEPNPQDSLAEALMAAGRFEEAEAAFHKASEISPKFAIAWSGIAQSRFLRGDWAGGREALSKAKQDSTRPIDKLATDTMLAWSQAAEGKTDEALKTVEALAEAADAEKVDVTRAFTPLTRAMLMNDVGRHEDALKEVALALEKAERMGLPGGALNNLRREALAIRIDAESKLGRADEAKKTLALIQDEAQKAPNSADLQSQVHYSRGSEAMARGDAKAAAQHFSSCIDQDFYCRLQLATAQDKAGDKLAAEKTRQQILNANRRDTFYLFVRSKVAGDTMRAEESKPR